MSKPRKASEVPDDPLTVDPSNDQPVPESVSPAAEITHLPVPVQRAVHPLANHEGGNILLHATFDPQTMAGKVLLSKCYGPSDYNLDTIEDRVVAAKGYCVYEGDVPQRDSGEIVRMACVRLLLEGGKILGWCSDIASEQFRRCVTDIVGLPPWSTPVRFRVRRLPSKAHPGGSWYTFELVGEENAS